jgi:hypothetical protein
MNREIHVRLCERLGAKFPGPTRRSVGDRRPYANLADHSTGNRVLASGNHKLCPCGFRYAALNFSAALRRLPVIK